MADKETSTIRIEDFNLEATLDCGQVFGFRKAPDGSFSGLLRGREITLSQAGDRLRISGAPASFRKEIADYFDLERDLSGIYGILQNDPLLAPSLEKFRGLRLIRQDAWEALACFILSSNNNVKRIQLIVRNLTKKLGEDGAFPTARAIARCHERTLRELGLGYRAPFLQRSALFVAANPGTLDAIRHAPYDEAVERVIAFPGIGPKVADCVLLYGFQKYEAFPVDVWIFRVMRKLYFPKRRPTEEKIRRFARKRWGKDAGYVQQYLFHGARHRVL